MFQNIDSINKIVRYINSKNVLILMFAGSKTESELVSDQSCISYCLSSLQGLENIPLFFMFRKQNTSDTESFLFLTIQVTLYHLLLFKRYSRFRVIR